jgi:hypothetical protein
MRRLISFLFSAFSDKEGTARASASTVAAVITCWLVFTPIITFTAYKAGQDHQNALLWAEVAQIKNTLGEKYNIFIPEIIIIKKEKSE